MGVLILVAIVAISGCTQNGQNTTESLPPNTVIIQNFAFSPQEITVKVGTTVTWINRD
jgi:plastocyanin